MLAGLCLPEGFLPGKGYIERLAVCSAAAWLIAAGNGSRFNRLLAWKPVVAVGWISYPLYLWHWPVLALLRYVYMEAVLPLSVLAVAMAGIVAVSWVSYRLVENPIRHSKKLSGKAFAGVMAIYFALGIGVNIGRAICAKHNRQTADFASAELGWHTGICNDGVRTDCVKGDRSQPIMVLAIGDSHTAHYNTFFDIVGKHEGWSAYVVSVGHCDYLYNTNIVHSFLDSLPELHKNCLTMRQQADQDLDKYQIFIFANFWQQRSKEENFYLNFEKTLQHLIERGKMVYVIKDNPMIGGSLLRKNYLQSVGIVLNHNINISQYMDLDSQAKDSETVNEKIHQITNKYPQVIWVDFTDLIPKDFIIDGLPIYFDTNHFNIYGSRQMGNRFITSGRRLLKPRPEIMMPDSNGWQVMPNSTD